MSQNAFSKEEKEFLEGPRARWKELKYCMGIIVQFLKGFRVLHFSGPCITVFGSARFLPEHPFYELTKNVAKQISQKGFTIMTGGGPGLMEAANLGAREAKGLSIGCNIRLPQEQQPNPYLDKYITIDYFFVRKELLRKYSTAFIVMPGGFGTMDEFFETVTLIQTRKIEGFPIVVMGVEYHHDLIAHIKRMVDYKTISAADNGLILFTDDVDEAVKHIEAYVGRSADKTEFNKIKPSSLLGETRVKKEVETTTL